MEGERKSMTASPLMRVARRLMRLGRRILPAESRDWAAAMEAELGEMKGSAALRWATGCLWVACRERLAALVRGGIGVSSNADLLALEMEEGMRRLARVIIVAAVVAPLLFLLAPSFRQGLALQTYLWFGLFRHPQPFVSSSELRAMAEDARQHGDAEALAFAALLHRDVRERTAWAEEAVGRQPELTWVYAVLLGRTEYPAEAEVWLAALQRWAPRNGFVNALQANHVARGAGWPGGPVYPDRERLARHAEWRAAMQAAFAAPEFDSYSKQQFDLIRAVMNRRQLNDPLLLITAGNDATLSGFSVKGSLDAHVSKVMLVATEKGEKGQPAEAAQLFRQVAALGRRMERGEWSRWERFYGAQRQVEALESLRALGEAGGGDPAFLKGEIARLKRLQQVTRVAPWLPAQDAALGWNGLAVQISFVAGMLAAALGAVAGLMWIALRGRAGPHLRGFFAGAGVLAILALCVASLVFYVSYKPYAGLMEYFLGAADTPRELSSAATFSSLWSLPLVMWQLWWERSIQIYFWYVLIAAGGIIMIWLVARNARRMVMRTG